MASANINCWILYLALFFFLISIVMNLSQFLSVSLSMQKPHSRLDCIYFFKVTGYCPIVWTAFLITEANSYFMLWYFNALNILKICVYYDKLSFSCAHYLCQADVASTVDRWWIEVGQMLTKHTACWRRSRYIPGVRHKKQLHPVPASHPIGLMILIAGW